jgi:hypothetical protein
MDTLGSAPSVHRDIYEPTNPYSAASDMPLVAMLSDKVIVNIQRAVSALNTDSNYFIKADKQLFTARHTRDEQQCTITIISVAYMQSSFRFVVLPLSSVCCATATAAQVCCTNIMSTIAPTARTMHSHFCYCNSPTHHHDTSHSIHTSPHLSLCTSSCVLSHRLL